MAKPQFRYPALALGSKQWLCGDWLLRQQGSGLWEATHVDTLTMPPLFAATRDQLVWLCNSWSGFVAGNVSEARTEVRRQLKAELAASSGGTGVELPKQPRVCRRRKARSLAELDALLAETFSQAPVLVG